MLAELVMAWARDIDTGVPRYIGEIDADHRGAKCGCECPSCGLVLIAVNAAKDRVVKRPHFRHPEGGQRGECSILAARAVAIRLLAEEGLFELPRRVMSATAQGLSGMPHSAWAESEAQTVRVAGVDFRDRAFAVLTLDDGRTLRVALTGGIVEQADGKTGTALVPTITIDIDAAVIGLEPNELRQRLKLLPRNICWQSHWRDAEMLADAQEQATALAIEALDWVPDDIALPDGLSPALRRETLLHHEVKRIIERAGQLRVPGIELLAEMRVAGYSTQRRWWSVGDRVLALTNTRLEHRMRPLVPDVVCDALADDGERFEPLILEVTVTNVIDEERLERIRARRVAALEIDLSRTGGRVTRSELQRLVVHEVSIKRWLHYPDLESTRERLRSQLQSEHDRLVESASIAEQQRQRVLLAPIGEIAARYLASAEELLVQHHLLLAQPERLPAVAAAQAAVAVSVGEMKQRGFPEAGDEDLLGPHRVLSRLLSIRHDRGVGYGYKTGAEVLNATLQPLRAVWQLQQEGEMPDAKRLPHPGNHHYWTLYFIAVLVYQPQLSGEQRINFSACRDFVIAAVKNEQYGYMRSPKYDRLISLLFPEMAEGLAKAFGKRPAVAPVLYDERKKQFVRPFTETPSRPAAFLSRVTPPQGDGLDTDDWYGGATTMRCGREPILNGPQSGKRPPRNAGADGMCAEPSPNEGPAMTAQDAAERSG